MKIIILLSSLLFVSMAYSQTNNSDLINKFVKNFYHTNKFLDIALKMSASEFNDLKPELSKALTKTITNDYFIDEFESGSEGYIPDNDLSDIEDNLFEMGKVSIASNLFHFVSKYKYLKTTASNEFQTRKVEENIQKRLNDKTYWNTLKRNVEVNAGIDDNISQFNFKTNCFSVDLSKLDFSDIISDFSYKTFPNLPEGHGYGTAWLVYKIKNMPKTLRIHFNNIDSAEIFKNTKWSIRAVINVSNNIKPYTTVDKGNAVLYEVRMQYKREGKHWGFPDNAMCEMIVADFKLRHKYWSNVVLIQRHVIFNVEAKIAYLELINETDKTIDYDSTKSESSYIWFPLDWYEMSSGAYASIHEKRIAEEKNEEEGRLAEEKVREKERLAEEKKREEERKADEYRKEHDIQYSRDAPPFPGGLKSLTAEISEMVNIDPKYYAFSGAKLWVECTVKWDGRVTDIRIIDGSVPVRKQYPDGATRYFSLNEQDPFGKYIFDLISSKKVRSTLYNEKPANVKYKFQIGPF